MPLLTPDNEYMVQVIHTSMCWRALSTKPIMIQVVAENTLWSCHTVSNYDHMLFIADIHVDCSRGQTNMALPNSRFEILDEEISRNQSTCSDDDSYHLVASTTVTLGTEMNPQVILISTILPLVFTSAVPCAFQVARPATSLESFESIKSPLSLLSPVVTEANSAC